MRLSVLLDLAMVVRPLGRGAAHVLSFGHESQESVAIDVLSQVVLLVDELERVVRKDLHSDDWVMCEAARSAASTELAKRAWRGEVQ